MIRFVDTTPTGKPAPIAKPDDVQVAADPVPLPGKSGRGRKRAKAS